MFFNDLFDYFEIVFIYSFSKDSYIKNFKVSKVKLKYKTEGEKCLNCY